MYANEQEVYFFEHRAPPHSVQWVEYNVEDVDIDVAGFLYVGMVC